MRKRDMYRKTEQCLYNYRTNLARLELLRSEVEELTNTGDIHVQDYGGRVNSSAVHADPVNRYVHKLLTLEHRISVLERYTRPITLLLENLQQDTDNMSRHYLRILEYFYFGRLPVSRILEITRWNRNTFYSRRHSLVMLAAGCLFIVKDNH